MEILKKNRRLYSLLLVLPSSHLRVLIGISLSLSLPLGVVLPESVSTFCGRPLALNIKSELVRQLD